MKEVVLVFPSSELLSDFIIENNVNHIDVNSCECKLTGVLSDELISMSCIKYMAAVEKIISSN